MHLVVVLGLAAMVVVLWLPQLSELFSVLAASKKILASKKKLGDTPRLLFLVPAHDEELMIAECVRSLLAMIYPATHRRVIVIADNCADATARIARAEGAEVLERMEPGLPGKPRAIDWALNQIDLRKWDACVIIDADSVVAPSFSQGVAQLSPLNNIVFQPNNDVLNEFENWLTRLGGLLGRCRFQVTYPLKQRAGLNCPISNGMGVGTALLMRHGWLSFSITEDTELYAIYTDAGVTIRHARDATVFSQESRSMREGATQRRRWLAGRLHIIRELGPQLLRSKNIGWRQKLDAFVELGLSGPVLHLIAALTTALVALFAVRGVAGVWIAVFCAASLSATVITVGVVLRRHPQPWQTLSSFLMLPLYAGWRVIVMLRTLGTLRDKTWRRTARSTTESTLVGSITSPQS